MRWIKCSDRTPQLNEDVLLWVVDYYQCPSPMIGYMQESGECFVVEDDYVISLIRVTHWQPLPNPPKELK